MGLNRSCKNPGGGGYGRCFTWICNEGGGGKMKMRKYFFLHIGNAWISGDNAQIWLVRREMGFTDLELDIYHPQGRDALAKKAT